VTCLPRTCLAVLLVLSLPATPTGGADKPAPKGKKANRLNRETSPYLLQHAHNPVDWYPWGPEAFAKAKKEGKLIFLSIGYSSCHWCHVMEKESFSKEDVAKILNEHFVCIKVDREERPDVDQVYMAALHVLGQRGGWPLSMFLTAEGKPIIGGTYWPPEDRMIEGKTIRGFKSILKLVADAARKQPKEVGEQADQVAKATKTELSGAARAMPLFEVNRKLIDEAVESLVAQFDPTHGGFGLAPIFPGPKFPTPPRLLLLQEEITRKGSKEAVKVLDVTLDRMARGGIYDHLGGGFHRYSTDRTWTVPHFEKMLYDNAQLVEVYALAWKRTKNPTFRRVVEETLAFIAREMTSPEGVFYSALDADSEGEEGRFYVWAPKEINTLLPVKKDADLFRKVYGLDGTPNFEKKDFILTLPETIEKRAKELKLDEAILLDSLAPLKARFLAVRSKRHRPFLDTKVLTGWNGQMIAGYALAGQALGEPKYTRAAARAANFLLKTMKTKDGRLLRAYGAAPGGKAEARVPAYLDDYAFLVHGLLNLHDATGEKRWLEEARALTGVMIKHHPDEKVGGFFYTAADQEKLFVRAKDQYDGAQPSGNSMAARNLVRLWKKTGEKKYQDLADRTFRSLAAAYKESPSSLVTLTSAFGLYLDKKK
jgi:uncharacterized protein